MHESDCELQFLRVSTPPKSSSSSSSSSRHTDLEQVQSLDHIPLTQREDDAHSDEFDSESNSPSIPSSSGSSSSFASDGCLNCTKNRCKNLSRRQTCCMITLILITLITIALIIWRVKMGGKFGKIDEDAAHLSFDSPIPAGEANKFQLRPALNGSSINILVWNLKKEELSGMENDLPKQSADRDLLIISEGYLNGRGQTIFNSLSGVHWEMGVAFTYKRDGDSPTGTMIGSHVLPTWSAVTQTVDTEPIINTPKCMTYAKYPITNSSAAASSSSSSSADKSNSTNAELLVISIHGINAVSADALDRQLAQAAAAIRLHVGPVIFAGDFNTNLAEKVSRLRALIADLAMVEVQFINGDARKKVFGQIIDYAFTRGLKVIGDAIVLADLVSSDHKALKLQLQLQ